MDKSQANERKSCPRHSSRKLCWVFWRGVVGCLTVFLSHHFVLSISASWLKAQVYGRDQCCTGLHLWVPTDLLWSLQTQDYTFSLTKKKKIKARKIYTHYTFMSLFLYFYTPRDGGFVMNSEILPKFSLMTHIGIFQGYPLPK